METKNNKIKFKKKFQIHLTFIIKYFCIQIMINQILARECQRNKPILKGGSCVLDYCTKEEFDSKACSINNKIIKTQWLNNIILINYKFVNFASNSKGDMFIETTSYPNSPKRLFFGITNEGKPFFNENKYFCTIDITGQEYNNDYNGECEGEVFFVTINDENNVDKEYFVNIGINTQYTEIYDLNNKQLLSQIESSSFLGQSLKEIRGTVINYKLFNNDLYYNYVLFGYISSRTFYLKKLYFTDTNLINNNPIDNNYYSQTYTEGGSISCFMTNLQYIICFTLHLDFMQYHFYIIALKENLEKEKDSFLNYHLNTGNPYFFKCIHLKGETGVFIFYSSSFFHTKKNPKIMFKTYDNNSKEFKDYLTDITEIDLDKIDFNNYYLLNDIIKISDNKICFTSTSEERDKLYIVIIRIMNTEKVVLRYYSIAIYKLNNYKFLFEMRLFLYKNFISFAFSFCPLQSCNNGGAGILNTALIFFSYANGKDFKLDLTQFLFFHNNIKIDDFIINLKENVTIDNNIFGLVYLGIKIKEINNCNNIRFLSSKDESKFININSVLEEDENIRLKFLNNIYNTVECIISYTYIIIEPSYEDYNEYSIERVTYGGDTESIGFNNKREKYEGKTIDYIIILENNLKNQCSDENCELCIDDIDNKCITCRDKYKITEENNGKIKQCFPQELVSDIHEIETKEIHTDSTIMNEMTEFYSDKTKINESSEIKSDTIKEIITQGIEDSNTKICTKEEILNNECNDGSMKNEQLGELFNEIKNDILTDNYNGENKVIKTENVVLQISTLEDQKNNINPNISTIDLGECENILKGKYNISSDQSLIVIKTDIKSKDLSSTYVQYEIYHPITKKQLNLNHCSQVKISVHAPVNLNSETSLLYDSLSEFGYNLFDTNDDFYNDICSTYTSSNGTDMTLEDRKKEIFNTNGNITLCQIGCKFEFYNKTTKKAKCNCEVQSQSTETDMTKIDFSKEGIASSFLKTLTNSNFMVLKCYKLAFNFSKFFKNKGRIIMSIIFLLYIISLLVYIIKDRKKISIFINKILKKKINKSDNINIINNNKINIIKKDKNNKSINNSNNIKKNKNKDKIEKINKTGKRRRNINKRKSVEIIKLETKSKKSKKHNKDKDEPPKRFKINDKITQKNTEYINSRRSVLSSSQNKSNKKLEKLSKININIIPIENTNYGKLLKKNKYKNKKETDNEDINIYKTSIAKTGKNNRTSDVSLVKKPNRIISKNLNDQELNTLKYELALLIDKRTYFQYYWSLLKKKQLIIFTILPTNDYNLITLKLSLFLLSFSLYFTINGFFFSDETMHKIHEDKGAYNIFYQIPQILYSSVISVVTNMILKLLSLSENNILALKHQSDIKKATKYSKNIERYITIKFIIFFILSNILLLFFWYFITCFCAVYINTQLILIKDTLISFAISMIYPFGINLLPGILRIPSLRDKKQNKKCLYQISLLVALI